MTKYLNRLSRRLDRLRGMLVQVFSFIPQFIALRSAPNQRFSISLSDRWVCLGDATEFTSFDRHYVFHTAWASRVVAEIKPVEHIDISSSLYFITSCSAFVPIKFFDYRPAKLGLSGLSCEKGDITNLPFPDNSLLSVSCMHVVEHIGLGRYGDPIDYDGDLRAIAELKRVIAVGGNLLFVVPIGGKSRIQFNAHRIYRYKQVVDMFEGFEVREFALIQDNEDGEGLIRHASEELADLQRYGCGCFWLRKISE